MIHSQRLNGPSVRDKRSPKDADWDRAASMYAKHNASSSSERFSSHSDRFESKVNFAKRSTRSTSGKHAADTAVGRGVRGSVRRMSLAQTIAAGEVKRAEEERVRQQEADKKEKKRKK